MVRYGSVNMPKYVAQQKFVLEITRQFKLGAGDNEAQIALIGFSNPSFSPKHMLKAERHAYLGADLSRLTCRMCMLLQSVHPPAAFAPQGLRGSHAHRIHYRSNAARERCREH